MTNATNEGGGAPSNPTGPERRPLLVLLDTNSLLYRAFFALPISLTTSSGQVTNAIYGFTAMLIKLLDEIGRPDAIAACFDKGMSFRDEVYDQYKAHREAPASELQEQKPLVREVLSALQVPCVTLEGYEADDLLATLSVKAEAKGWDTLLVTGDRDSFQLISPHVKVMTTRRGITDIVIYDEARLHERYELTPDKIADMMGLKGDTSDNIPGVPGIGEKTAIKLIKEYGSLEAILEAAPTIKQPKLRQNLIDHAENARMSKTLATMHRDLPVEVEIEDLRWDLWDVPKVRDIFGALEFPTLMERLFALEARFGETRVGAVPVTQTTPAPSPPITDIADELIPEILALGGQTPRPLGIDYTLTKDDEIAEIAFSNGQHTWRVAYGDTLFGSEEGLRELFHDYRGRLCYADAKPLAKALLARGIEIRGDAHTFDVGVAAYLLDPTLGDYTLETLSEKHLSMTLPERQGAPTPTQVPLDFGEGEDTGMVIDETLELTEAPSAPAKGPKPTKTAAPYNAADWSAQVSARASVLVPLAGYLEEKLEETPLWKVYTDIEAPLILCLARMEHYGIHVDREYLAGLLTDMDRRIAELTAGIHSDVGEEFNIGSPLQLQQILFDKLGLKSRKKTKTGRGTDASVLRDLIDEHPAIAKILEYRELTKLKGTYIDGLLPLIGPKTGRIHTTFNQKIAATGRLSSSEPNLQNIPVRTPLGQQIRRAFVPGPGYDKLLVADYSQVELRIVAHLSGDAGLIDAFESGQDVHTRTAAEVFGLPLQQVTPQIRNRAKAVNFGIVYGISGRGLSEQLKIPVEEADEYIGRYFARYTGVKEYNDRMIAAAHRDGFVTTLFGRRRNLPELTSGNFRVRSFGERLAVNTPIQGSAADFIKLAMIRLDAALRGEKVEGVDGPNRPLKSRMLLQVHDELVLEVTEGEAEEAASLTRSIMEGVFELRPSLKVDLAFGLNWQDAKA